MILLLLLLILNLIQVCPQPKCRGAAGPVDGPGGHLHDGPNVLRQAQVPAAGQVEQGCPGGPPEPGMEEPVH